jgi:hypothetical protein
LLSGLAVGRELGELTDGTPEGELFRERRDLLRECRELFREFGLLWFPPALTV